MALSGSENLPIEVDAEHLKKIILKLFGKSGYILDKCFFYDLLPFDIPKLRMLCDELLVVRCLSVLNWFKKNKSCGGGSFCGDVAKLCV